MAMQRRSARGISKSEPFVIRFDPKTKYLVELAARAQRRSASSFIEQAVVEALKTVEVELPSDGSVPLATMGTAFWDVDDADRFVILATLAPTLLTFDEQVRWKLVNETFRYWKGGFEDSPETRARLRRFAWLFHIAVAHDYTAKQLADALKGDEVLREELSDLKKESDGSVASWLDDTGGSTPEHLPARKAKTKSKG
ncbi:hypothetical protein QN397_13550 [Variovorax sp. RTB1]|uniref:hypothetical protein n=1 Tax=Variovorax sp. RTB1 TaxID=3048631 RepID=UPI002B239EF7|nr:hypothetical protein [Variovorax sp. RTB1]MEB0112380.1 hypothetical protein [Variovorax sp. RTB1]